VRARKSECRAPFTQSIIQPPIPVAIPCFDREILKVRQRLNVLHSAAATRSDELSIATSGDHSDPVARVAITAKADDFAKYADAPSDYARRRIRDPNQRERIIDHYKEVDGSHDAVAHQQNVYHASQQAPHRSTNGPVYVHQYQTPQIGVATSGTYVHHGLSHPNQPYAQASTEQQAFSTHAHADQGPYQQHNAPPGFGVLMMGHDNVQWSSNRPYAPWTPTSLPNYAAAQPPHPHMAPNNHLYEASPEVSSFGYGAVDSTHPQEQLYYEAHYTPTNVAQSGGIPGFQRRDRQFDTTPNVAQSCDFPDFQLDDQSGFGTSMLQEGPHHATSEFPREPVTGFAQFQKRDGRGSVPEVGHFDAATWNTLGMVGADWSAQDGQNGYPATSHSHCPPQNQSLGAVDVSSSLTESVRATDNVHQFRNNAGGNVNQLPQVHSSMPFSRSSALRFFNESVEVDFHNNPVAKMSFRNSGVPLSPILGARPNHGTLADSDDDLDLAGHLSLWGTKKG
jgi:hypothetical protein